MDGAPCAIAFDRSSTSAGNANTLSWTQTTAGADRLLVVGVSVRPGIAMVRVNGITYAGIALAAIGARSSGTTIRVELWQLVAPPTGTNTIAVDLTGAQDAVAGAVSLTRVSQTGPVGASMFATGTGTTTSVALTTGAAGSWVIDIVSYRRSGTAMAMAPQVERWASPTGQAVEADGSTSGPHAPSTVSMGWTLPSSSEWAAGAVSIASSCP